MTIQDIKDIVGPEQYQEIRRAHLGHAPLAGLSERMDVWGTPSDIRDLIWDEAMVDIDKVSLTFEVYADMPCYALMIGVSWNYDTISAEARDLFWMHMRGLLGQESETLAEWAAYTLWCDYFERYDRVERAWAEVTGARATDAALKRILIASGPVPFTLKEALYARLVTDKTWHYYIFRSLLHSTFDVFGAVDKSKAFSLLHDLDVPPETENLPLLRQALLDRDEH